MAVIPDTLIQPKGRIEPAWFALGEQGRRDTQQLERDALERLEAYVLEGEGKAAAFDHLDQNGQDDAARAWAYYRAFEFLHIQWAGIPAQMNVNLEGGRSYLAQQVNRFAKQEAKWKAEFDQLSIAPAILETETPPSRAVANSYVW